MKKIFLITFSLLLLTLPTLAQQKQTDLPGLDFSGTWGLDVKKSFSLKERRESYEDYVLEIIQKDAEIKINAAITFRGREFKHALGLFTDKRGEENVQVFEQVILPEPPPGGSLSEIPPLQLEEIDIKTKTSLDKDKLFRRGMYSVSGRNYILEEDYKLSKDGKTLTIRSIVTIQVSTGVQYWRYKLVFQKKES